MTTMQIGVQLRSDLTHEDLEQLVQLMRPYIQQQQQHQGVVIDLTSRTPNEQDRWIAEQRSNGVSFTDITDRFAQRYGMRLTKSGVKSRHDRLMHSL